MPGWIVKLARFRDGSSIRLGLVEGDQIVDLRSGESRLPDDLLALLRAGDDGWQAVRHASRAALRRPLSSVRLCAPIAAPRKFLGLGLSFRSHVEELRSRGDAIPAHQVWFNKQVTAVNGPFDPIHLPKVSRQLDYEGELAIVIGRKARHVHRRDAMSVIAGYLVCNDLTVRDWQRRTPTATLGKSFDTHGPIGPWLTTADEILHPENLRIRTWVDGELRQDGNTSDLIYSFGEMIEELTTAFTLEPGDILTTGTPSGIGAAANPPRFLEEGQVVRVEVERLGWIENEVVAEPC
jgi:2-keto-4-pentenoate hydratase/2-oxohepta-3-ene-1,7-dioic acid hydratase in catechol pathway